ncbi:MAG: hypothetical protein IJJ99_01595 [Oscillospiraceae bacterium]|nr:hypothetical protein [Oscillospiraceae bacterium]
MKKPKIRITKDAPINLASTTAEELLDSKITPELNEAGQLVKLAGCMEVSGVTLRFSLSHQCAESSSPYRGTICIIDPATGRIMKAGDTDRSKREKSLKNKRAKRNTENGDGSSADTDQTEVPAERDSDRPLLLRRQITFKSKKFAADAPYSDICKELAEYLVDRGKRLCHDNLSTIYNRIFESVTPKTITPLIALMLYFDTFVSKTRSQMKADARKRLKKEFELFLHQLPEKSMSSFIKRDFRRNLRFQKLSGAKIKALHDFWDYCSSEHYCEVMDNPIPLPEKRAESELERIKAASTPRILSTDQIAKLYQYCLDARDGLACGICLLLNGYAEDFSRKLKWKDVSFEKGLVLILNYQAERTAATKDYTRPCNMLLGQLLQHRYQALLESGDYKENKLKEMPIVSDKSPEKVLDNKAFVERCTSVLGSCGVKPEVFLNLQGKRCAAAKQLLRNTYEYLVCSCMGIDDDDGTKSFLLGRMLESTTDNNYASYTSPEASERLYAIQNRCLPAYPLSQEKKVTDLGNGMVRITLNPKATNETLTVTLKAGFSPDVQISASARHGVSATASVRELKEDGTPKRASRKSKANSDVCKIVDTYKS